MGPFARGGPKPQDVGNGVVCASFDPSGVTWLSLGRVHQAAGFVELSGAPPFDETWRGRPEAVRRYRMLLADVSSAFLRLEGLPAEAIVEASAGGEGAESVTQHIRMTRVPGESGGTVRLSFLGSIRQPPLAMITEVGSIRPPAHATSELQADGARLRVHAHELETEALIEVVAQPAAHGGWGLVGKGAVLDVEWPRGRPELVLEVRCSLHTRSPLTRRAAPAERTSTRRLPALINELPVPADLWPALEVVRNRALGYVRGCTALRPRPERVAILTDHRLLPLSWTRDAYYQALALLRAGYLAIVADHLRWLWLDCLRPAGWWARSHHANGRRKDEVFQADQQLYPLLELADYRQAAGRLPAVSQSQAGEKTWSELVGVHVRGLLGRLADGGLLATDENAADDPAAMPFLLANQVLAWHTLRRLSAMAGELPALGGLEAVAERLRLETCRRFVADGPQGPLWAYAIDGRGKRLLYHDANDVPTTLAPAWGFCSADDPIWRSTIDFAFSPSNPGYVSGRYGGLGSRHTEGVWPLGLAQEWVARGLQGQTDGAHAALRRLVACALSDGSLPESSDPETGRLLARPWFAWPGALVASLLPLHSGSTASDQPD